MKQLTQGQGCLRPKGGHSAHALVFFPLLVLLVACVSTGFALLIFSGRARTRQRNLAASIAAYAPGQSDGSLHDLCPVLSVAYETCTINLDSGDLARVHVQFVNGEVSHVFLTFRENTVRVGHLMLLWGRPEIERFEHAALLHWQNREISALVQRPIRRVSPLLPVARLTISRRAQLEPA